MGETNLVLGLSLCTICTHNYLQSIRGEGGGRAFLEVDAFCFSDWR